MSTAERRPTLADVAALSGMSKSAVSMILNNRPGSRLSAESAERVRSAAAQLGYRPNPAAQSLRLGKTRSIGLISDEITLTRYASGMISGVLAAAKELDHSVVITETGGDFRSVDEAFQTMLDRRVDGVLVGLLGARLVDLPEFPKSVPLVIVNGETTEGHPSILPDEWSAGRAVAQSILDAGHRRIGIIGGLPAEVDEPRRSVTIWRRFAGVAEVLSAAGVEPVQFPAVNWVPQTGHAYAELVLNAAPDVTAIIAANDNVAFGVYQALWERGLRVGDDISVISFDDEELAGYQRPGLTTARLPYEEMARRGVEMLLGTRDLAHELVPMPLIVRDSVRQLRTASAPG